MVKNLSAMQETWIQSQGQEDPLHKGMATHSQYSCLKNFMDREEPGRLQSMGLQRVLHNWATTTFTFSYIKYHFAIYKAFLSFLSLK